MGNFCSFLLGMEKFTIVLKNKLAMVVKMKIHKPFNSVVPFMTVYPTEIQGSISGNTCMGALIATSLLVARPNEDPESGK